MRVKPPPYFGTAPARTAGEVEDRKARRRLFKLPCLIGGALGTLIVFLWVITPAQAQAPSWFNGSVTPPWWHNNTTANNTEELTWYQGNLSNITGLQGFFGMLSGGGPWSLFGESGEIAGWFLLFAVLGMCLIGRLPMDTIIIIIFAFCLVLPVAGLGSLWMWGIAIVAAGYIVVQGIQYWIARGS